MLKPLVIHKDNSPLKNQLSISSLEKFDIETFDFGNSDLDTYISQKFISKLQQKDFNIIFIKDNLSDNYLELYGITLAYHIRLSSELGDKRFIPIVIISDVDGYILNKLTPMANILFTKNTFVARNEIASYRYFEKVFEQIKPFSDFKKEFLDLIHIDPPQDYLSHHDISNEWSIYRWAEFLNVVTTATKANKSKIENMLYFKYLKAKFPIAKTTGFSIVPKTSQHEGNILYIDDEWDKGWKDIFKKYFSKSKNIKFHFVNHQYEDTTYDAIECVVKESLNLNSIDTVLLDMRLTKEDHEQNGVKELSGIKLLKLIESFNPGIQVILLTASEKSAILDEANKYNILGYIKKENPSDDSIYTKTVFEKLKTLIDLGFERKYLKKVFLIQRELLALPLLQITFSLNMEDQDKKLLELKNTISRIFETLDSNIPKPFVYAMLTIYKCLEIINDYYIYEQYNEKERKLKAYWRNNSKIIDSDGNASVNNKTKYILKKLGVSDDEMIRLIDGCKPTKGLFSLIDEISCSRNYEIHFGEIKSFCKNKTVFKPNEEHILYWFSMIQSIIDKIRPN